MLPLPTVEDFADAAREFIAWVEGEPGEPMDEARTAQQHLARLYYLATFLREVEPEGKEYDTPDTWDQAMHIYKERFKTFPIQHFGVIFHPTAEPPEQRIEASAPDCLRDIWIAAVEGLHHWDAGHRQEAEYMWHDHFNHWGHHITELLYALHMHFWMSDNYYET